jgi:hypothetical protein
MSADTSLNSPPQSPNPSAKTKPLHLLGRELLTKLAAQPEHARMANLACSAEVYFLIVLVWSAWRAGRSKGGVLSGKPAYEGWAMLGARMTTAFSMSQAPSDVIDALAKRIGVKTAKWYGQDTVLWLRGEAAGPPLCNLNAAQLRGPNECHLQTALSVARLLHDASYAGQDASQDEEAETLAMLSEAERVRLGVA